jgi:hypothetical protein
LGCETQNPLTGVPAAHQASQKVGHLLPAGGELNGELLFGQFVRERLLAAVVGHSRRHGDGIGTGLKTYQGLLHIGRRVDGHTSQALQQLGIHGQRTMHQSHLRPTQPGCLA